MQSIPGSEDRSGILQQEIFFVSDGWYQINLHSVPMFSKPADVLTERQQLSLGDLKQLKKQMNPWHKSLSGGYKIKLNFADVCLQA